MVIYSMSDALQPAISYCFGAGLLPRMRKMQRIVMSAAAILSLFAIIINIVLLKLGGSTAVVAVVIARRALKLIEVKR